MNYSKQIILKNDQGEIITIVVDGNRVKLLGTWQHLQEFEAVSQESKDNLDKLSQDDADKPTVEWYYNHYA